MVALASLAGPGFAMKPTRSKLLRLAAVFAGPARLRLAGPGFAMKPTRSKLLRLAAAQPMDAT